MDEKFLEFSRKYDALKGTAGDKKNIVFSIQGNNLLHQIKRSRTSEADALTYLQSSACRKPVQTIREYFDLGFIRRNNGYLELAEDGYMFLDMATMDDDGIRRKYSSL